VEDVALYLRPGQLKEILLLNPFRELERGFPVVLRRPGAPVADLEIPIFRR
jgi:hypothetical protein